MHSIISDFRYALRSLRRTPMLAVVALLSMALGIGANTAIFSLLDEILLRLMPVKDPQSLVIFKNNGPFGGRVRDDGSHTSFSYPLYKDMRDHNQAFSGVMARFGTPASLTYNGVTERGRAELVSGNYFDLLGVRAAIGRTIGPEDDIHEGAHPVMVLSSNCWRTRFGSNRGILNQSVLVNGRPMTVIGVAQEGFRGFESTTTVDFFIPMMMKAQMTPGWDDLSNRRSFWAQIVARLKPGITREQAQAAVNTFYKPVLEDEIRQMPARSERFRREYLNKTITLVPGGRGHSPLRQQFSTPLIALMAMAGLVLLIACANVANLLLSRAAGRQKEIAIRLALGASRRRLIAQLLIESVTLSIAGGLLGSMLAIWASRALISMFPSPDLAQSLHSGIDVRVLGFSAFLSLLTGVLFGIAPALQATRPAMAPTLKEQANATTGSGSHVLIRHALVVAQVALSLVLLIGAGLFVRSLYNLRSLDPGFRTDHIMTFSIDPSLNAYKPEEVTRIYDRVQRTLSSLPGVQSVSMAASPLMSGSYSSSSVKIPGYHAQEGENMSSMRDTIGPHYFSLLGIPLMNGREFDERDGASANKTVIVSEYFAKHFFGNENPIGRRIQVQPDAADAGMEVIGVAKDIKHGDLQDETQNFLWLPYEQNSTNDGMTFYVRTVRDPAATGEMLTRAMREINRNLPVYNLRTLEQQTSGSLFVQRSIATLSSAFGLLATLLAAIGLYGVMAYSVARRTREIGIRMALGASAGEVRGMIMKQVAWLAGIGIGVAIPVAFGLTRFVKSQLFGLAGNDPATFVAAALAIAAMALVSGLIPAMRAVRIQPTVALRYE
jgi:predicted permease